MRNMKVDALKGFAIILVVVGHGFWGYYGWGGPVLSVIYSFHMALMMFAAGLVFSEGKLSKRARQLLLPALMWLLILVIILRPTELWSTFLWFLPMLFIYYAVLSFAMMFKNHVRPWIACLVAWLALTAIGVYLLPMLTDNLITNGQRLAYFWPFFCAGFLLKNRAEVRIPKPLLVIPIIAFAGLFYWIDKPITNVLHLTTLQFEGFSTYLLSIFGATYSLAILGILASVAVVMLLPQKATRVLAVVGWYAFDIYIMHVLVMGLFGVLWLEVILGVLLPILAGTLIRKVPGVRLMLLGGRGAKCPWLGSPQSADSRSLPPEWGYSK